MSDKPKTLRGLEKIARDLDLLLTWYCGRGNGLTFRALGERFDMTESAAKLIVDGSRAEVARTIFGRNYAHLWAWRARGEATQGQILAWLEAGRDHASELIRRLDA